MIIGMMMVFWEAGWDFSHFSGLFFVIKGHPCQNVANVVLSFTLGVTGTVLGVSHHLLVSPGP